MDLFIGPRLSGKTHRLVDEALRHGSGAVIVVSSLGERDRMVEMLVQAMRDKGTRSDQARILAKDMVVVAGSPLRRSGVRQQFFVDNFSWVLARVLGASPYDIAAVTDVGVVRHPVTGQAQEWLKDNPHLGNRTR